MTKKQMVYNELIKKAEQAKEEAATNKANPDYLYGKAQAYQDAASYFGSVYKV